MEKLQIGILTLIRSAVTGQALPLPEGFSLMDARGLIKRHELVPLVCEGALLCGMSMEEPIMAPLMRGYGRNLLISEEQLHAVNQVFAAFEENGIEYMPLKGCSLKAMYPKPELRVMGDADVLIRTEQYRKIIPIMEQLGFTFVQESNHEFVWKSSQLYLELHKCLIPSYNKDYYSYFGNGWRLAAKQEGCRYEMSPEDNFIYLFTHFAKHYRDGGIGCRHVTDLWVYLRRHPGLDMLYVRKELRKLQLLTFYHNICRLLEVWFEDAQTDERTDFMSDFIFLSGSWGEKEAHILSAETRHVKAAGSMLGGRLRSLWTALFPSREAVAEQYPMVQKHPALLPVFWPIRLVDILLFRRDAIRVRREKWKLSSAERLDSYQQSLRYVGLDFRFEE